MQQGRQDAPGSEAQQLGRYRLIAPLGQGGMGTIHLAVAEGLGQFQKLCVVKELRRDLASNANFVEMFLQEAKLAARLNHANVVNTLEAGQVEDRFFLSMEFLDGRPYSAVVSDMEPQSQGMLQLRLQVLCEALSGLHYAHELRDYDGHPLHIVHRDVSPQNVFITYDGRIKVLDFGIAKAADARPQQESAVFKGKLGYAAPEQLLGHPVDRRTDVFAVGVMLWEAIALRRFSPSNSLIQEALERRLSGKEPAISEVVPDVDPVLARICDKALSQDPAGRFATAEEFRLALSCYAVKLGPWLTPGVIGPFMEAKFASERAAIQRLIRAKVNDDPSVKSIVRPVQFEAAFEEGDKTPVADLSELVEVSRSPTPAPGRTRSTVALARWAGVAAAVAGIGLAAVITAPDEPSPEPAPLVPGRSPSSSAPGAGTSPAPAGPQGPRPPSAAIANHGRGQAEGPGAGAARPAPTGGRSPMTDEAATARRAGPADRLERPAATRPPMVEREGAATPNPAAKAPLDGRFLRRSLPVRRQTRAATLSGRPAQLPPPASPVPAADSAASSRTDKTVGMGEDLHSAPRTPRRSLDTKNPYAR